ncbi:transglutaminase-like cysteine peptidase [Azonexus sp. IMCC34839]|uniref:transglutaminase-like cysteine peptidase n=1 Tax=Azonexus sp. IMCC34839 TaxID=3133695 RepID=UPI00399BEC61
MTLIILGVGAGLTWVGIAVDVFPVDKVLQAAQQRYGASAAQAVRDWNNVLGLFRGGSEMQRLKDVNEFFNRRIKFVDDQKNWGENDYWATPIESLVRGAGDCEDYAIAKYFTLKFVGVPVTKLRITYVRAIIGGAGSNISQAHMVLTYYPTPDAEPLVLDNLVGEIRPASRRADLQPIFSFNSEGVYGAGGVPQPGGGSRISKWNDLIEKMKAEGIE